jgi:MFS family permease
VPASASLNGLFQQDLGTSSAQLTWISDVFLIPVCVLELSFGVLGDLFGRKRLLLVGALMLAVGEFIAVLTPGASVPTGTRLLVLYSGLAIAGIGAAALFPTTLAMLAAGTHGPHDRARAVAIWAAALSVGNCTSPILGGLAARLPFGSDPLAGWRWACLVVMAFALISALVSAIAAVDSSSPEGRQALGQGHRETLAVRANLAHAYHATGRLKRASAHFDRAPRDCEQARGPDDELTKTVHELRQRYLGGRHGSAPIVTPPGEFRP